MLQYDEQVYLNVLKDRPNYDVTWTIMLLR